MQQNAAPPGGACIVCTVGNGNTAGRYPATHPHALLENTGMRFRYNRQRIAAQHPRVNPAPEAAAPQAEPTTRELRAAALRRQIRQHAVKKVYEHGPRIVFELLDELVRHFPALEREIDQRLDRYSGLDPQIVRILRVDRFPAPPLRLVPEGEDMP